MANHTHGIIDHSMKNGLQINLKDAIEDVGVKVPEDACLWQYPEIIRQNLVAKTVSNINLLGKDIIKVTPSVENGEVTYNISTSVDTSKLIRPAYAENNTNWGGDLTVDQIFKDLFTNILPAVKGLHAGDMTTTDGSGNDVKAWNNTLFGMTGTKSGLVPSSKYLRLYLTSYPEPLYIYIDSAVSDITGGFNVVSSDTVHFTIDENTNTISASINSITDEQINNLI